MTDHTIAVSYTSPAGHVSVVEGSASYDDQDDLVVVATAWPAPLEEVDSTRILVHALRTGLPVTGLPRTTADAIRDGIVSVREPDAHETVVVDLDHCHCGRPCCTRDTDH